MFYLPSTLKGAMPVPSRAAEKNPPTGDWVREDFREKVGHENRLDSLVIEDLPDPKAEKGQALIEVKAFGINHAEIHMRKGEWAEAAKVSGIECVGIVRSCPGGEIPVGKKVAAFMGGLGRTINRRIEQSGHLKKGPDSRSDQ
jgi:NADPH:quinone reductase-like Zn-dependent oxidoreductase